MITKAALSLLLIGASGAYVWSQSGIQSGTDLAEAPTATAPAGPVAVAAVAVEPPLIVREVANTGNTVATASLPPLPRMRVRSIAITPEQAAPTVDAASQPPAAQPVPAAPQEQMAAIEPANRRRLDAGGRPIRVSATLAAQRTGRFVDGVFDGPAIDAFYGLVQIEAIVQGGKLSAIKVLRYPSDRRTSVAINRQALPMLRAEAIAAQSANVDAISGATLTSEAFIESLGAALRQAASA